MGRLPPHEYTDEPRGGFEQIMDKLPQTGQQPDTNDASWTAVHSTKEEPDSVTAARNGKSYFVFASFMTLLGLSFSIVSMVSCSFGVVHWAVDGSTTATQYSITHLGLFRWYNPRTSSCWAYTEDMADFLYVNGAARGLSAAAVTLGGCAALIILVVIVVNLGGCIRKESCSQFNLNSTSLSTTFFVLAVLIFISSILQISTLTYFNQGNLPDSVETCNANKDSNCTMGVGAHYGVGAFIMYLLACFVYAMAGVGCRLAEMATPDVGDLDTDLEESLLGTV